MKTTMADEKLTAPKQSKTDIAHTLAKVGLSAIPGVGGPAVELFQYLIQPPLEKRRGEWMVQVGEKLQELETKGLKLDELQKNEEFVSAVMHASQIALRTHQSEKLDALRNAIVNVAKGQAPDATLQNVFLNLVDSFTELHLRILKVFQAPSPPPGLSVGGLSNVLEHNIPRLRSHRELYDQLWKDLYTRGLVDTGGLHMTMSDSGLGQKRTTGIGDAFISFIEEHK